MVVHCCPSISISITKPLLTLTRRLHHHHHHHRRKPKPKFSCLVGNIGVDDIAQLAHNKVLVAAAASAAIGQLSKPFTSVLLYGKDFDVKTALQAGGFPSTHSSGVRREVGNHAKTLNTMLPKRQVNSVVSEDRDNLVDSREVNTESAGNFERLGPISSKISGSLTSKTVDTPLLIASNKESRQTDEAVTSLEYHKIPLKESIGHTEVEVVAGALLGFLVSLAVYSIGL